MKYYQKDCSSIRSMGNIAMHKLPFIKYLINSLLPVLVVVLLFNGCVGGKRKLALDRLQEALKDVPSYSIILEDMKEEGNFRSSYYHKYRVMFPEETQTTDWMEVSADYYKTNESFLGMSLAVKKEGEANRNVAPPGYQYVGDSRYGNWRSDSHGNSFWEFYGKYAFFSSLLGGGRRPIYRNDYSAYQQHRARNATYFGRKNEYGTNGSISKKAKPNFHARRMAKERMKKASFKNRVAKRTGRTRTGFRSRSGGFGK